MNYFQLTLTALPSGILDVRDLRDAAGEPVDERRLARCVPYTGPRPLRYHARLSGSVHDWNWGFGLLPYVRTAVTTQLLDVVKDDVELVPLEVDDVDEPLSVVNILSRRACVDEERSLARRITAADNWPERLGEFKSLGFLTIDEARVGGSNLFRIAGFEIAMVASQRFVDAAKRVGWTGIDFLPTYDGPPRDFRGAPVEHPSQH